MMLAGDVLATPAAPRTLRRLESGQTVRIVCFGDSITGVYYHTGDRRAWCDLLGLALQRRFPAARIEMLNAGISGQTTGDALPRLETDVLAPRPDLVVLMFGMNDAAKLAPETYRANLREFTSRIRARGAELIFMTPNAVDEGDPLRPPDRVAAYAEIMREVGRELAVPVADAFQTFRAVQLRGGPDWWRLMSNTIHPNLHGHILFAETAAQTLVGGPVALGELPILHPGLPHTLARLEAGEALQVVAMKPYDVLIGPALRHLFPKAEIRVTAWDPSGKSLEELEAEAKQTGWFKFQSHPATIPPDLVILAVPVAASAPSPQEFYRSYSWILNWSQAMGKPAQWDCLPILPSVAQPDLSETQRNVEASALTVILGKDLPVVQRAPGNSASTNDVLTHQLETLLHRATP
ncbi:MAG: GDSL-type esterase/lipase family protein [Opitutaceae bacterium]